MAASLVRKAAAISAGLSPHTVRNHLKAIFRKAKVGSQAELVDLGRSAALGARP